MQEGLTAEITLAVSESDTALALGSGDVPVLATPRIVALCEQATVAAVAGRLASGKTSVGTRIECDHVAPSAIGDTVSARATLVEADGRRLHFTVTVTDLSGAELARALVWRVVVDRDHFLSR